MLTRDQSELDIKTSSHPIRSVEVDLNGLRDGSGPNPGIAAALARCLRKDPSLVATVYVRIGPSTNFHEYTWSAFIAPVGPAEVLDAVKAAFVGLGARARISEAVRENECVVHMHVEAGMIWVPDEPGTWCALEPAASDSASDDDQGFEPGGTEGDGLPVDEEETELEDDDSEDVWLYDGEEDAAARPNARPLRRQRAARNDASIGTIIRKIENAYGLPAGSVALRGPDRKVLRRDALIVTLRRRWDA